jgi:NADH:ubiquinone oxidoreductase subunit F (NADH-binding)
LHSHGSALGCAVIKAYSTGDCMVRELGRILHFFAHGSCGQCPRCRMETSMLDTILRQVLCGRGNLRLLEQIDKVIDLARGEGICGLIGMPAAPARTCLKHFREEFIAHIEHRCPACSAQQADSSTLQAGGK